MSKMKVGQRVWVYSLGDSLTVDVARGWYRGTVGDMNGYISVDIDDSAILFLMGERGADLYVRAQEEPPRPIDTARGKNWGRES